MLVGSLFVSRTSATSPTNSVHSTPATSRPAASAFPIASYQRPVQLTCAQLLVVIEVTVLGSLAKKFHALQQASTMSS